MSDLSVTNTFTALTTAVASEVNANFSDIVNYINNRDDGTATWDNVNVTATVANPVTIKSNQSTCEVAIDNTATDGDPILSFKLSGTTTFVMGIDDGDSDSFKIGTSAIGTNTRFVIDSSGEIGMGGITAPTTSLAVGRTSTNTTFSSEVGILHLQALSATNNNYSGIMFLEANNNYAGFAGFQIRTHGASSSTVVSDFIVAAEKSGVAGQPVEKFRVTGEGNIVCGPAALATNATDGFLHIPTCAGAPTGTPTAYTGTLPLVYDSTNNRIYVYDGSWLQTTLA